MKYDVDGINLKKELKLYRMELDLNEEPLDPTHSSVVEFDSILDELESAHGHIQDRIRHLEAVTSRARQRQRWPIVHSPIQITNFTGGSAADNAQDEGMGHQEVEEGIVESGKGGKGKGSHLIAKALGGVETNACKAGGITGNLFDCNICFGKARDPVLTCCGHLFCWPCFYQLPYAYSKAKECPVCNGEVTETGIIPIYGNASGSSKCQDELKEAGLRVPSRPRAPRIESTRQQLISQGASSSVIRNIRQFHNLVSGLGEQVQSERPNTATDRNSILLSQSRLRTDSNQHTVSHPVSRFLVQGTASFSSLSSALNSAMDSAERLVEDLESYMHGHQVGGSRQSNPRAVNRNSTFSDAATNLSDSLARDVTATNSAAAASVPPSIRNVDTIAVLGSETTHRRRRRRRTEVLRRFSTAPRRRRPR